MIDDHDRDEDGDGQQQGKQAGQQQEKEFHRQAHGKSSVDDAVEQTQRLAEPDGERQPGGGHQSRHGHLAQQIIGQSWHVVT